MNNKIDLNTLDLDKQYVLWFNGDVSIIIYEIWEDEEVEGSFEKIFKKGEDICCDIQSIDEEKITITFNDTKNNEDVQGEISIKDFNNWNISILATF